MFYGEMVIKRQEDQAENSPWEMNPQGGSILKQKTLRKIHERLLKTFMDMVILAKLMEENPMSGYDVIEHFHKKFDILFSSGTVYSVLYSMERNGLIKGMQNRGKRVYKLTNKGEKTIKDFISVYKEIQNFTEVLLSG